MRFFHGSCAVMPRLQIVAHRRMIQSLHLNPKRHDGLQEDDRPHLVGFICSAAVQQLPIEKQHVTGPERRTAHWRGGKKSYTQQGAGRTRNDAGALPKNAPGGRRGAMCRSPEGGHSRTVVLHLPWPETGWDCTRMGLHSDLSQPSLIFSSSQLARRE